MNRYQKNLVEEMVKMDFETGLTENDYDEVMSLMEEDEDLAPVAGEATDYYFELLDMGPAEFYEEFPEMNWDEDYVNQYSEDNDAEIHDDEYAYEYASPERQKLYNLFKKPCDHCDTVLTFEVPSMTFGTIWFDGEIGGQENRCIQRIVDNLKNEGYTTARSINKGDHCTITWNQEVKESVQKKSLRLSTFKEEVLNPEFKKNPVCSSCGASLSKDGSDWGISDGHGAYYCMYCSEEMRDMRNIRSLRECGNCNCFAELKSVLDSRDIRYSIENFDEGSEMFVSIAEGYTDEVSLEISCENGEYVTLINCDSDRTINGPKRMHFSSAIEVANYIDDLIVQYNDFYLA